MSANSKFLIAINYGKVVYTLGLNCFSGKIILVEIEVISVDESRFFITATRRKIKINDEYYTVAQNSQINELF